MEKKTFKDLPFKDKVHTITDRVARMLIEKNEAYGDSALNPVRIFSRADRVEQLRVRIDDKLSRLARGHAAGEDVIWDLIGYFMMLLIALSEDEDMGIKTPASE